jgi:hypothetical protein
MLLASYGMYGRHSIAGGQRAACHRVLAKQLSACWRGAGVSAGAALLWQQLCERAQAARAPPQCRLVGVSVSQPWALDSARSSINGYCSPLQTSLNPSGLVRGRQSSARKACSGMASGGICMLAPAWLFLVRLPVTLHKGNTLRAGWCQLEGVLVDAVCCSMLLQGLPCS